MHLVRDYQALSPFANIFSEDLLSIFAGREFEMERIRRALAEGARAVAVVGPAGSGKTSVTQVFAKRHSDDFSGGIAYTDASSLRTAEDLLRHALPKPLLPGLLLIVDEVAALGAVGVGYLRDFLDATPQVQILATSRDTELIQALTDKVVALSGLDRVDFRLLMRLRAAVAREEFDEEIVSRLFAVSQGSPAMAQIAIEAVRSGGVRSWEELFGLLQDFRAPGILGPDGRPLGIESEAHSSIVIDISSTNEELLSLLRQEPRLVWELPPRRFEEIVAELLAKQGYEVELTPASGDGGFDIYAARKDGLGQFLYLVECKRYVPPNKVGVEVVRSLYGVVQSQRATAGAIVTTSYFTAGAEKYRRELQHQMHLHDYIVLQKWLRGPQFRWSGST